MRKAQAAILTLGSLLLLPMAHAQTYTWTGGGSSSAFSNPDNWLDGVTPAGNGSYVFTGTAQLEANNDLTLTGADNTITFGNDAGAFTLSGLAIRAGGVTNESNNLQTIGLSLRYNGGRTIDTGAAGIKLTVAPLSTGGARTITKTGSGDLIISATGSANNIGFSVNAGRIVTENNTGSLTLPILITLASNTSAVFAQTQTVTVNGGLSGAGFIHQAGTGTTNLNGPLDYTGGTVVSQGQLVYAADFTMSGDNVFNLIGSDTPVRGDDYGFISTTGSNFAFGGTLEFNFTGSISNSATYDLFDFNTTNLTGSFEGVTISGSYGLSLTFNGGIWSGTHNGMSFAFSELTGDLTVSAIPEPSAFALMAGVAGLGLAGLRRRRRA